MAVAIMPPMSRSDFRFFHRLRVRWAEVDLQKVVFNGNYLTYFDVGFTEYWREVAMAAGLPGPLAQQAEGFELFARKTTIEYHDSARFDDWLDVGVRCTRLGRSSLTMGLEIFRDEAHLISGELVYVYVETAAAKSRPIPDRWRTVIREFERLAPEEG